MRRSLRVFGVVLAALLVFFYNGLIGAREQVNAGWAQVENVYQRRLDLVPLLVDAVQTYTEHERETLAELTQARANALQVSGAIGGSPQTVDQLKAVEASQGKVESALARLFAIVENYPDLKASQNFLKLQTQLVETEDRIQAARRFYNGNVRDLNTLIEMFPSNLIASIFSFTGEEFFDIEEVAQRAAPQVRI